MEFANPPAAAAAVAVAAPTGTDWRSQLHPMAREVMGKQIMKILKKHIPVRDSEGLNRLQNIAKGFEEKFYNSASTQSSYLWKIASLLRYVEAPNHNPNHQGPAGLPPQGNSPVQSSSAPLMSRPKTRVANISASVQASLPGQSLINVYQTSVLQNADRKGKAPMPESPGDETIEQEFWDNLLCTRARDDEVANSLSSFSFFANLLSLDVEAAVCILGSLQPQNPATDAADKLELADPSENIQIGEAADPVNSGLPLGFSTYEDRGILIDMVEIAPEDPCPPLPWVQDELTQEEGRNYISMVDGTTNLKKRKFDGASSSASVFGQNTSGLVEDHSSSPAPPNSYSRWTSSLEDEPALLQHFQGWMTSMTNEAMPDCFRAAATTYTSPIQPFQDQDSEDLAIDLNFNV